MNKNKISIVDLVGAYNPNGNTIKDMSLGRRGMYECPFCRYIGIHTLIVSAATERYHCINCLEDGDVVDYLVRAEGMTEAQAKDTLNALSGRKSSYSKTETLKKKEICRANAEAAKFYMSSLKNNKDALNYLQERGITDETIRKFALGYSGGGLYKHLKSKGVSDEVMVSSGLFSDNEKKLRNKIFERVMFPIITESDNGSCEVVGFGGRLMNYPDAKYPDAPKYLNTSANVAFDKKSTLFAFNFAKKSSKLSEGVILCEGYMDVIALHQAGFDNAVASLGTAFTRFHAMKLAEVTKKVYLCFDSDKAGVKAKMKAIPILRKQGLDVKILSCSPYKDPDELIKALGCKGFEDVLRRAMDSYEYEIRHIKDTSENFDKDVSEFIGLVHEREYENYINVLKRLVKACHAEATSETEEEMFYLRLIERFAISC